MRLFPCLFSFAILALITPALHAAPGDLDPLDPNPSLFPPAFPVGPAPGGQVSATAEQPDGKTILTGYFKWVHGVERNRIARLNADGSLDTGFNPNADNPVYCVTVQPDGKILIGGSFTTLQPNGASASVARGYIARLNADGTVDTSFDPRPDNEVNCLAIQADGKILLGGLFNTFQPNGTRPPLTRKFFARLFPDGTLDTAFDPQPTDSVWQTLVQADGKILLCGSFYYLTPNGAPPPSNWGRYLARVHENGTLDTTFNPILDDHVIHMALQAGGKVLLSGRFRHVYHSSSIEPAKRSAIARVNDDGTPDQSFDPAPNGSFPEVYGIAAQADGKVLLSGQFSSLQPNGAPFALSRPWFARVNGDGTLDGAFDPQANDVVTRAALQSDGKIWLLGRFNTLQPNGAPAPVTRSGFARLQNSAATQSLTVPNTSQVLWQRGGAAPELNRVTFELSTNGGSSWALLGSGTRVGATAHWQLSNLSLPATAQLRARGFVGGSIFQQITSFTVSPDADNDGLLDSWERTWWPDTAGHGPHDDDDHDGLDNLVELAFGLNPTLPDAASLPSFTNTDGYLTITLTKRPGAAYEIQSAADPLAASFSAATTTILLNDATTLQVRDNIPSTTGPRRFIRVKVTAAP